MPTIAIHLIRCCTVLRKIYILQVLQPIILLQLPIVYYHGEEDDGEETSKEERGGEEYRHCCYCNLRVH